LSGITARLQDSGLEVLDLRSDPAFLGRRLHVRDAATQLEGIHRLARAFVESPDSILQELVNAAVDLCGADSAGISMEKEDGTEKEFYHWVATAGQYSQFLNAILPRYPSACGVCLERGGPQLFRVGQQFFDLMGIEAPLITDGILLPWQADGMRGTIFIMAHGRSEAFDQADGRMMQLFANFAAMGVRQQRQQKALIVQASAHASAAMANKLAHEINNPLQSLTNLIYLASQSQSSETRLLAQELSDQLQRLSALVAKLLELPGGRIA
jgi:hypothetical protein